MGKVVFKAYVLNIATVTFPDGEDGVKIDIGEKIERPLTQVIKPISQESGGMFPQEIKVQIMGPMPRQHIQMKPRVTLWLSAVEWETLDPKPSVGDIVTVTIEGDKVTIRK